MRQSVKRKIRIVALLFAAMMATVVVCRWSLIRVIWYNLTAPSIAFDESAALDGWDGGQTIKDIAYAGKSENQRLTLYLPEGE